MQDFLEFTEILCSNFFTFEMYLGFTEILPIQDSSKFPIGRFFFFIRQSLIEYLQNKKKIDFHCST